MGSKKDIIFYIVAGNILGIIMAVTGADWTAILLVSLIAPPVLLIILRIFRLF